MYPQPTQYIVHLCDGHTGYSLRICILWKGVLRSWLVLPGAFVALPLYLHEYSIRGKNTLYGKVYVFLKVTCNDNYPTRHIKRIHMPVRNTSCSIYV